MLIRAAAALLLVLLASGLSSISCQSESPLPEKTVQELAKENTITHHTGVNVTEVLPRETLTSNSTETPAQAPSSGPSTAPHVAPSLAPDVAPGPAQAAEVPSAAPATAPSAGIPAAPGNTQNKSPRSMPHHSTPVVDSATPAVTPAATSRPSAPAATMPTQADTAGAVASDKDLSTQGASIASSSRYGSVAAGTLVAAVVIIGLTGTFMVWRRRSSSFQGLHDTEMAMLRREH